ncbi:MAG: hypothetical protein WDZ59_11310 [Pirellulales bacterium]
MKPTFHFPLLLATIVLLAGGDPAFAFQDAASGAQSTEPETEVISLTLTPAGEPVPALKYKLLPPGMNLTEGNAATFYYRAILAMPSNNDQSSQYPEMLQKWADIPIEQLPKDEIRAVLPHYHSALGELHTASTRRDCEWSLEIHQLEGPDVISFRLQELQPLRTLARVLQAKSRLQIADGQFDDAVRTMQIGYRLAQDVGKEPLLINGLVGMAISSIMNQALTDLIDTPGSPNMYWALTHIDRPLVDLQPALRYEMGIGFRVFPFLQDPETSERGAAQWAEVYANMFEDFNLLAPVSGSRSKGFPWQLSKRLGGMGMVMLVYPNAKKQLIERGYSPARVEAMPAGQVVAIHAKLAYEKISDEHAKWYGLPYWLAKDGMDRAQHELTQGSPLARTLHSGPAYPIAMLLLPAVNKAMAAHARFDRDLVGIQAVEAIRLHAAKHGALPESLGAITDAPIPPNPATGELFPYRVEAGKAILDLPPVNGANAKRYEIVIEKN